MDRTSLAHYLSCWQGAGDFEEFMTLIEIPNVYTSEMTVSADDRGRFAVIGEPIVAVDLIETVAVPGSPSVRCATRESGRPRRFRSQTKRRSRSSCGAATMAITSRSSTGSMDRTVAPVRAVRAENGTSATPMPAAASCAAVRGLPVRSTGWGSTTPRSVASWSTHAAIPLPGS